MAEDEADALEAQVQALEASFQEDRVAAQKAQSAAFGRLMNLGERVANNHLGANILTITLSKFSNTLSVGGIGPHFSSRIFINRLKLAIIPVVEEFCGCNVRGCPWNGAG